MHGFRLIELLAAVGSIFLMARSNRANPDGLIGRFLRHRDRIWFALLLLFVPAITWRFLFLRLFLRHPTPGPNFMAETVSMILNVFYGATYGIAGCLFASPAQKKARFSYWLALTVTVVLIILTSGLSMLTSSFRFAPAGNILIASAAVVVLAFLVSRAFVARNLGIRQESAPNNQPAKTEYNPAFAFVWLLVGLAPIPILLVFVSSNPPNRSWAPVVLIVCAVCNLYGGLGCLGRIKNVAVRVILGIFLGIFFFLLSWLVAAFEACSHSGGI